MSLIGTGEVSIACAEDERQNLFGYAYSMIWILDTFIDSVHGQSSFCPSPGTYEVVDCFYVAIVLRHRGLPQCRRGESRCHVQHLVSGSANW